MTTELEGCVNCHICEMVCSLHHTGSFSYQHASIRIQATDTGFGIVKRPLLEAPVCDRCAGEHGLLCIKYCPPNKGREALAAFILRKEASL